MRIAWLLLPLTFGCAKTADETDTDADTDTDTDSDTDTDTDTDSDTDTDTEAVVVMTTTLGDVEITLDPDLAPVTTANFLAYVDSGFYDGDDGLGATLFHRVIPGFVAQGGGVVASGSQKTTLSPIENESDNGLSNLRGTIAMARTTDPDSATSQFFVNVVDNVQLDIDGDYPPGYAVFGRVTAGMDVVDAIVAVPTDRNAKPIDDIVISDCERK